MREEALDHAPGGRERGAQEPARLGLLPGTGLERAQDLFLAPLAETGELPQSPVFRRSPQRLQARDPELGPDARSRLRPDARKSEELDHPGRNARAAPRQRLDLPRTD